eukprot:TRINITY_DN31178_c0_g1_i1.p1 TRINITY_DN31178_c0_g1~~TRINITY_DN31178_c0_g1_i1.p1  ORF type:complete len:266 (-),score=52.58 TRINITY_DN31178_c0_g1_i1:86-784(-)
MASYAFAPPAQAAVPIHGSSEKFPIHRIYCVGRNYVDHAIEMGHSGREAPFFFNKPADSALPVESQSVGEMPYPSETKNLQHEIELVVAIGSGGKNVSSAAALSHVFGYAIGLDMTRRDLQNDAKKLGRPWCTGKGFDFSAPIGPIFRVSDVGHLSSGRIALTVNGQKRQESDIQKLIWNISEVIEHLSKFYELRAGDLIYTGTPEGVGTVVKGDLLEASIVGLGELKVRLV